MKLVFILLISVSLLSGCMTINEKMLRTVNITPPENNLPLVEIKSGELMQKLNGKGDNRGVFSGTTVLNQLGKSMMIRWKLNGLIDDYGFAGDLNNDPDYTVTLSGTRNEDASMAGAVLTGLTLFLIPSSSTLTYDLQFYVVNNHTHEEYTVKAKNAVTTWMQILLLPALPFSWIGSNNMINDIADYSYNELSRQGAFSDQIVSTTYP